MGMPEGTGRKGGKSAPQRRKRKPTERRTSISVLSGIAPCVTVDDSSQQATPTTQQLPSRPPPLVHYTPQMAQSSSQASDPPFTRCFISGNWGAGKNIPSHASPPTIFVCGTRNGGSFSTQVQLYPKPSIPMLIITATSPVFSLVAPSSHRIYSSYQQISPYNFYLSTAFLFEHMPRSSQ